MTYLLSHYSAFTLCIAFTILCILISWLGLFFARKKMHSGILERNHEVAAAIFDIAGLLYSLLLAFIIIAVWSDYEKLDDSVEKEATKLGNINVHATELNDTMEAYIKKEVSLYAGEVVKNEWNTQPGKKVVNTRLQELRQHLYKFHPDKDNEQRVLDIIDDLIDDAIDLRHDRMTHNESHVPGLVWLILLIGTTVTIMCSYLFSVEPPWLHYFYVTLLTCLVAMCLFLIYMLDHPFEGSTHISNEPFLELSDY